MRVFEAAVVGAGIHGLSVAKSLAERGHNVTLFDQWDGGQTDRGSSHGKSRIIRRAYPDRFYTECMKDGYPLWQRLEKRSHEKLIHEVGLFYFGSKDSANLREVIDGLRDLRVPYEVCAGRRAASLFPRLELKADEMAVFTPEAGWVDAEAAIRVTSDLAAKSGCVRITKNVRAADLAQFEKVVVCPGAWIKYWLPHAPIQVTLQTTAYVKSNAAGPVWIEDSKDLLYGFPSNGPGVKIGVHRQGAQIDPNSWNRNPSDEYLELIRSAAKTRFGIANPEISEAKGCLYTNTPTEDFLIKRLNLRTWVVSACSGHGFKFGPWIGELMADVVEDRVSLDAYPRFGRS